MIPNGVGAEALCADYSGHACRAIDVKDVLAGLVRDIRLICGWVYVDAVGVSPGLTVAVTSCAAGALPKSGRDNTRLDSIKNINSYHSSSACALPKIGIDKRACFHLRSTVCD